MTSNCCALFCGEVHINITLLLKKTLAEVNSRTCDISETKEVCEIIQVEREFHTVKRKVIAMAGLGKNNFCNHC